MGRNIRLNCIHKQELRRNDPHSRSSKKSLFRPLFRAFYPHPANRSFLSAGGATHFLGPGKRVWPPTSPGHCSPAPRSTPPSAGTSAVRSHADPPPLATACHRPRIPKNRTGPDLDERALYLIMSPNQAIPAHKSIRSFPRAAAHPLTVLSWPKRSTPVWHYLLTFQNDVPS